MKLRLNGWVNRKNERRVEKVWGTRVEMPKAKSDAALRLGRFGAPMGREHLSLSSLSLIDSFHFNCIFSFLVRSFIMSRANLLPAALAIGFGVGTGMSAPSIPLLQ